MRHLSLPDGGIDPVYALTLFNLILIISVRYSSFSPFWRRDRRKGGSLKSKPTHSKARRKRAVSLFG
jgi:hypothetical protein